MVLTLTKLMFYKISDDGISVLSSALQIYLIKASNILIFGVNVGKRIQVT